MDRNSMLTPKDRWCSETLDDVFIALSTSEEISRKLVYKGARVLRLLLNEPVRASLDIDASFAGIAATFAVDNAELEILRSLAHNAIASYFEAQNPVRYSLDKSSIRNRRKIGPHPRHWDVYWLELDVRDSATRTSYSAASPLRIDIAAPELTDERSIATVELHGHKVNAVTLERMAGEKLRAFLSSLPTYRKKIEEKIHPPRAKDLYDLARIVRKKPLDDPRFWIDVGCQFTMACKSRFIDCEGIHTFKEHWATTEEAYVKDPTIPDDVPFTEAEQAIEQVVRCLSVNVLPLTFPLPSLD
jgi:hypothetical protein